MTNVLGQYAKDGLAFQRYRRLSQTGEGKDILANNCSIIVGLYRNLFGVQPEYNRLYLEPHLTPKLNGTRLNYWLRGKTYHLDLNVNNYSAAVDNFTVRAPQPFAINSRTGLAPGSSTRPCPDARGGDRDLNSTTLEYFNGPSPTCALAITLSSAKPFELTIGSWPNSLAGTRRWSESCQTWGLTARHYLSGMTPNTSFLLSRNGRQRRSLRSDASGRLVFKYTFIDRAPQSFEIETSE